MITKKDNFSAIQQKVVILTLGIMEKRLGRKRGDMKTKNLLKRGQKG